MIRSDAPTVAELFRATPHGGSPLGQRMSLLLDRYANDYRRAYEQSTGFEFCLVIVALTAGHVTPDDERAEFEAVEPESSDIDEIGARAEALMRASVRSHSTDTEAGPRALDVTAGLDLVAIARRAGVDLRGLAESSGAMLDPARVESFVRSHLPFENLPAVRQWSGSM